MRFLLIAIAALFLASCSHSGHKHEGHEQQQMGEQSGHECTSCDSAKKAACGCDKEKDAQTCAKCDATKKADCACDKGQKSGMMMSPTESDKITQKISQEEFAKLYASNQAKLGKTCTNPAMAYCGKTTKDMMVSEAEAGCLWSKVFRVSRETLPELDGTPCAKMIKGFVKK